MRVGLTFFLHRDPNRSIWQNGGDQHLVFLWMLLQRCAGVEVVAINGGDGTAPQKSLMLGELGLSFEPIGDALLDTIDVLIEGGAQVSAEHVERVRARGGRAIAFRYGNAYVIDAERVIHNKAAGAIYNGARFDEVWTNAQHARTCGQYWELTYRCPVRVLPHIWDPFFVEATVREFPPGLSFGYQPGREKKRIGIFEPNVNIVKTCILPLCICEAAYRKRPELVGDIYATCALELKDHLTFKHFAGNLDIVKNGLASFEGRHKAPWFLAKFVDVVVAHQWENALNFAYYDALHGGYPLVHNSELLPSGVGYRYDGFEVQDGANALLDAIDSHDDDCENYRCRAAAFLDGLAPDHPRNIALHERALLDVAHPAAAS
jgi:hypothetical protein